MPIRTYSRVYKARGKPSPKSLEALADKMSGAITVEWGKGITRFGSRVNRDSMEQAVRSGDYKKVSKQIPWEKLPDDLGPFARSIGQAAIAGGGFGADEVVAGLGGRGSSLPPSRGGKTLNQAEMRRDLSLTDKNPKIRDYIGSRTGELVQNVTDNLQATIQRAVLDSKKGYGSPRQIADTLIDANLPLNDRQSVALQKYSASVRETYGDNKKSQKTIDAYASQLQDQRAMMIGRTEASFAANFGQQQVWLNAKEEGLLAPEAMREWVTESNPCEICLPLNGVRVGLDEPWTTIDGDELFTATAHPNCRCAEALVTEGLA
jgi:hypothetical protein